MHSRLGIFTAAILAAAASAATAAPGDPDMVLGVPVAAPVGYVEFCQRAPAECPELGGAGARFDSRYWTLAFQAGDRNRARRFRAGPPSALRGLRWSAGQSEFRAPAGRRASAGRSGRVRIELTPARWDQMSSINASINQRLRSGADRSHYGVEDRWTLPLEEGRSRGDCEDYVLEKRRALIQAGVPYRALTIALVLTRWDENHAVLLIDTDAGVMVLDNLSSRIQAWGDADYRWITRQDPSDPAQWVEVQDSVARPG